MRISAAQRNPSVYLRFGDGADIICGENAENSGTSHVPLRSTECYLCLSRHGRKRLNSTCENSPLKSPSFERARGLEGFEILKRSDKLVSGHSAVGGFRAITCREAALLSSVYTAQGRPFEDTLTSRRICPCAVFTGHHPTRTIHCQGRELNLCVLSHSHAGSAH